MKKLITLITMFLLVFSLSAADPAVLFGLMSPISSISGETLESETTLMPYDLTYESVSGLMAIAELNRIGTGLTTLLSGNLLEKAEALAETGLMAISLEDADIQTIRGNITITPDSSAITDLEASLIIEYHDFSMLYYIGSRTEILELDGKAKLTLSLSDESLAYLSISTENFTMNGDTSLSNSSTGIRIFFDYDRVSKWMNFISYNPNELRIMEVSSWRNYAGYDFDELRTMVASMLVGIDELAMLGIDTSSEASIISSLEEKGVIDILDAAAFLFIADSEYYMDELIMFSLGFIPVLYINDEEINLKPLMDNILDIIYIADSLW